MRHFALGWIATIGAIVLIPYPPDMDAIAAAQGKCVARKTGCMAKKAMALLECERKAETPGKPLDPNARDCVTKATRKFDGGTMPAKGCFEKLEEKSPNDCVTFDDTAAAEEHVDDCVAALVAAIDPSPREQSKCNAGKTKCVAKKLKGILECHEKAQMPGKPVDPDARGCITEVRAKFDGGSEPAKGCVAKLESKPGNDCLTPTGDPAALEAIVDSCAEAFVALIQPSPTTTTGTSAPSTTTSVTTMTTSTTSTTMIFGTSSTTTSSTSTTTTTMSPFGAFLDFTIGTPGGVCGETRDGNDVLVKTLTCGGFNIGGGSSIVPEVSTPDGSTSRFALSCTAPACTVGPTSTAPPVNSEAPDCTDAGCNFGTPLPIPIPAHPAQSSCVLNTWSAPASGTFALDSGDATLDFELTLDVYITGNLNQPCPRCSTTGTPSSPGTGTCDRGPRLGLACTTTSSTGLTRDCPPGGADATHPCTPGGGACVDGTHVGTIPVAGTGGGPLAVYTGPTGEGADETGLICVDSPPVPPQIHAGCFGSAECRSIDYAAAPAGPVTPDTPASATLASVFCIGSSGDGLLDASADLPGPGAASWPGTFLFHRGD